MINFELLANTAQYYKVKFFKINLYLRLSLSLSFCHGTTPGRYQKAYRKRRRQRKKVEENHTKKQRIQQLHPRVRVMMN